MIFHNHDGVSRTPVYGTILDSKHNSLPKVLVKGVEQG
jgi:hypothetical protein